VGITGMRKTLSPGGNYGYEEDTLSRWELRVWGRHSLQWCYNNNSALHLLI